MRQGVKDVIGYGRRLGLAGMAIVALSGAIPAAAAAQAGPAFTDHSRAATDQYGTPGGSNGGGQAGQPNNPGQSGTNPPGNNGGGNTGNGGNRGNRGGEAGGGGSEVGGERRSGETGGAREQGAPLPLADSQGGSLPFTGLDLMVLVVLGLLLLCAGAALRLGVRARTARRA